MCLKVEKIKHSYKYEIVNGEKMIPVWKILRSDLVSPYYEYSWKHGLNTSDYKFRSYDSEHIYNGFHFYVCKQDALTMIENVSYGSYYSCPAKVYKMYVRKEDIIEKGTFNYLKSLVAKKAYFPN